MTRAGARFSLLLEKARGAGDIARVTNRFKDKYLVRGAQCAVALVVVSCGGRKPQEPPVPAPTIPLPTAGLAGQKVSLFPLTLVAAEDTLHWEAFFVDRRGSLRTADSIITDLLSSRAPEVNWMLPDELRRAARRSAGIAADPDQLGTAVLRAEQLFDVPDPLRSQMRTLAALSGGRYAVVPAALVYRRSAVPPFNPTAELSIVLVDTRLAKIEWRTVARGEGADPWSALARAVKALTPGLP